MNPVVEANDWLTCSPSTLIDRLGDTSPAFDKSSLDRLRPIGRSGEQMKGRAAISIDPSGSRSSKNGGSLSVITIGGMRSYTSMSHITGVFIGRPLNVARNSAAPIARNHELADWATEQAELVSTDNLTPEQQLNFASIVCVFKGDPGELIIAQARCGYMNATEITEWALDKEVVILLQDAAMANSKIPRDALDPNVLVVEMGWPGIYQLNTPSRRGMTPHIAPEYLQRGDSLEERCASIIFQAWDLPQLEAQRQLQEHTRVVNAYEDARRKAKREYISARDDPDFPFREEIATQPSGARLIEYVTRLVRKRNSGE